MALNIKRFLYYKVRMTSKQDGMGHVKNVMVYAVNPTQALSQAEAKNPKWFSDLAVEPSECDDSVSF